jgi:hypothetical protein
MSWRDRGRIADHFSATSHAGGEADQNHEVRQAAGRGHRLQIQRLQAGRVTPCTQTSRSAAVLLCMAVRPTRSHFPTMQGWFVLRKLRPHHSLVCSSRPTSHTLSALGNRV